MSKKIAEIIHELTKYSPLYLLKMMGNMVTNENLKQQLVATNYQINYYKDIYETGEEVFIKLGDYVSNKFNNRYIVTYKAIRTDIQYHPSNKTNVVKYGYELFLIEEDNNKIILQIKAKTLLDCATKMFNKLKYFKKLRDDVVLADKLYSDNDE